MFAALMTLQWVAGSVAAYLISPKTWIGFYKPNSHSRLGCNISRRRDQFPYRLPGRHAARSQLNPLHLRRGQMLMVRCSFTLPADALKRIFMFLVLWHPLVLP